ncbi:hypothetical protein PAAG_06783 [Paracoccidioides lutzii Pb01]|uniref:DUF7924 domain-containing protein n=1 Tax=Paracoccidioides lutzii (strain ATCC MYA-826 / Pb01) TaxID=502779 RepID=C1H7P2_PARBA|nr:hypothetical protein PAAG_06783 [Paracoccidioides lutzii Pb01]EEH36365.2 hypothetical protein PAAG_06783 [Paracoccidioides lutzii Pb01]
MGVPAILQLVGVEIPNRRRSSSSKWLESQLPSPMHQYDRHFRVRFLRPTEYDSSLLVVKLGTFWSAVSSLILDRGSVVASRMQERHRSVLARRTSSRPGSVGAGKGSPFLLIDMAPRQAKHYKGRRQQPSTLQIKGNVSRPRGIRKELQSPCRTRDRSYEEGTIPTSRSPLPASCPPIKTQNPLNFQVNDHRRKRACDTGEPFGHHVKRLDKRQRTLTNAGEDAVNGTSEPTNADLPLVAQTVDPDILHSLPISPPRCKHKRQDPEPKHLPDNSNPPSKRPRTDIKFTEYWALHEYEWPQEPLGPDPMEHFIARSKTPSLRRTESSGSLNTASETSSREAKNRPYTDKNYDTYLETKGCFMYDHDDGIDGDSRSVCHQILNANPEVPKETVFQEGDFESTCRRMQRKNETGVIRIIGELIVPSAESAIDLGRVTFPHLVVSVNEGWDSSISLDESQQLPRTLPSLQAPQPSRSPQFRLPKPQPDYAVGFTRQVFTETQLEKLAPFVGEIGDTSFFMSTAFMYFPFMTAEVKCGKTALDIADRQNAHSMTLSVRGVVKLFRLVKREKELHRQILAFSISHDHRMVRIYGHYPVIDGKKTTYYRHSIHEFSFAALDGREKWTSYKFVMGVYDDWQSEPSFSESTGLSQGIEGVDVPRLKSYIYIGRGNPADSSHLTGCSLACSSSNAGK